MERSTNYFIHHSAFFHAARAHHDVDVHSNANSMVKQSTLISSLKFCTCTVKCRATEPLHYSCDHGAIISEYFLGK